MSLNKRVAPIIAIIGACLCYAASVPSQAVVLTWTLQDLVLREFKPVGTPDTFFTATGSFAYDAQTHLVTDWDITLVDPNTSVVIELGPDVPCERGPWGFLRQICHPDVREWNRYIQFHTQWVLTGFKLGLDVTYP